MPISTMTSKGQITIPVEVREFLKLAAGDQLEFLPQENGTVILVPATMNVTELKGMLPRPKRPISLDAMQKAIRKRGGGA